MSLFVAIKNLRDEVSNIRDQLQNLSKDIRDIRFQIKSGDLTKKERLNLNVMLTNKISLQDKVSAEFQRTKNRRDEVQVQIDYEKSKPTTSYSSDVKAKTSYSSGAKTSYSSVAGSVPVVSAPVAGVVSSVPVVSDVVELPMSERFDLGSIACDEPVIEFEQMGLPATLLRAVMALGYDKPTKIQQLAIRTVASGKDTIGLAPSGTGKTGAFVIGSLARVDPRCAQPQVIILAPNRELIEQIADVAKSLSSYPGLGVFVAVGDGREKDQIRAQVIVGTPAKVSTLIRIGLLSTARLQTLVMDEADALILDDEKCDQIRQVLRHVPSESQVAIFSATMDKKAFDLANLIAPNAVKIDVRTSKTLAGLREYKVEVEPEYKTNVLCDLYPILARTKCVVFCKSIDNVKFAVDAVIAAGHNCVALHSQLDTTARAEVLRKFRNEGNMLVTTDIIGRGIDIPQVAVVVNFDVPFDASTYIHRTGRSCRYGKLGTSLTLVTSDEKDLARLKQIEEYRKEAIVELPADVQEAFA